MSRANPPTPAEVESAPDPLESPAARWEDPRFSPIVVGAIAVLVILTGWIGFRSLLQANAEHARAMILNDAVRAADRELSARFSAEVATASLWARNELVIRSFEELEATDQSTDALLDHPSQRRLRERLGPVIEERGYRGFFLVTPEGTSLASTRDANTGTPNLVWLEEPDVFDLILAGHPQATTPQFSDVPLETPDGEMDVAAPTMFVGAPIRDGVGDVEGVLLFRVDPLTTFSPSFVANRSGETGEVIAFDDAGRLLTRSRFEPALRDAGLMEGSSFLTVELRAPPLDLSESADVSAPSAWPLTTMATTALAGQDGVNVDGYRNYLGRETVGSWIWDDQYRIGIAAEQARDEAYAELAVALRIFNVFAVGTVFVVGGFVVVSLRYRRRMRMARDASQLQAHNLRTIIDQASDALVIADAEGRVVFVNDAAERMFAIDGDEDVGVLEALIPRAGPDAQSADVPTYPNETMTTRADGTSFPASIATASIGLGEAGEVTVTALRDHTAMVEQRARLIRSNADLEHFAFVAAHDLQEPLRKVQAFGDLLTSEIGSTITEDGRHYLNRMRDAAASMQTLIRGLLAYSRVTMGDTPMESVDLEGVLAQIVEDLTPETDAATTVRIDRLPVVYADREQMRTLFQNLIENAIKYRSDERPLRIDVTSTSSARTVEIVVADNGIGFEPQYADQIFSMFERLHGTSEYPGPGVGLAVCRRIVERHGGNIMARVNDTHGASFIVEMPSR